MKKTEIIYPLNGLDIIPVKAEEVICFTKEVWYTPEFKEKSLWIEVELENRTILRSNRYDPSEVNNPLRLLLKRNDFVIVKLNDLFLGQDQIIGIRGVKFSAIIEIGKFLNYVKYVDGYGGPHIFRGNIVESTVKNYEKWKKSQEDIWRSRR